MPSPKEIFMKATELLPGKSLVISNLPKERLNNLRTALYRAKDSLSNTTVVISSRKGEITLSKLTPEELLEKEYDDIIVKEIDENDFSICIEENTPQTVKKEPPKKPGEAELTAAQAIQQYHQEKMTAFAQEVNLVSQSFDSPDRQKYAEMNQELSRIQKKIRDIKAFYSIEYIPTPAPIEEWLNQEKELEDKMTEEQELALALMNKHTIEKAEKKKTSSDYYALLNIKENFK
jgi:hypothetical protein